MTFLTQFYPFQDEPFGQEMHLDPFKKEPSGQTLSFASSFTSLVYYFD